MHIELPKGIQVRPAYRPDGGVTVAAMIPLGRELVRLAVDFDPESVRRAAETVSRYVKLRPDTGLDVAAAAWTQAVLQNAVLAPGSPVQAPTASANAGRVSPLPELVGAAQEVAAGTYSGRYPQRAYELASDAFRLFQGARAADPGAVAELRAIDDGVGAGLFPAVERRMAQTALASFVGDVVYPTDACGDWIGWYEPDAADAIGAISRARRGLDPWAIRRTTAAFGELVRK